MTNYQQADPHRKIGYQTVESKSTGLEAVRLTDEPYSGIIFQYGRVEFIEDPENDRLRMKFDYEVLDKNNKEFQPEPFERYIGDLLTQLVMAGILTNSLTYTGGVDEN